MSESARETHYWLRPMSATGVMSAAGVEKLLDECNQLIAILTTIVKKVRSNKE
jgi:four helix bundle protein